MRVKTRTVSGLSADPDGIAVDQPIALGGAAVDDDGLALSQVFDIALSTTALASAQNLNTALDVNDFAVLQTYASGVALTLLAAAATISPARRVSLVASTDRSGTNFTIVGVGVSPLGVAVTGEVLAGPNNTTVNSVNAYSSVTSITPDATSAVDQISAGWPAYLALGLSLQALAASLIPPRNISLVSGAAADFSNVNFTVTGAGNDGAALVEVIAGPNNSTVSTTGFFSSVTSIRPNRAAVSVNANISAGYPANSVPQPATLNGTLGNGIGVASDVFPAAYVSITSASNLSARTFTVVGLGQYGSPRTDVIIGPNAATTYSAGLFTQVLSVTPDDDAANNFSVGVSSNAGTGLTLLAGAASLDPPRRLVFDSDGNAGAIVFTIVGKDRFGNDITETVTAVTDSTPVTTHNVYASVTRITPSAASTASVFVGFGAEVISAPLMLDHYRNPFNVGLGVDVTGTVNYTVQHTFEDLEATGTVDGAGTWYDHDTLAAQTADQDGNYAFAVEAIRLVLNSGSGSAVMKAMQSGPRG